MDKKNALKYPRNKHDRWTIRIWGTALFAALMTISVPTDTARAPLMEQKQAVSMPTKTPKQYAFETAVSRFGWHKKQQKCLAVLWGKEAAWNFEAKSPTHDYGIPQRHMKHNTQQEIDEFLKSPIKQIDWGLNYIKVRYGSPCQAWLFWQENRWY